MTIRHMKIFMQVYQMQNITQAAKLLRMTQPAVTRAIQEIENYYGVCLFERLNRRLLVTENGKQLYAQVLHIVDAFDTMEKSLRNWDMFGVIRVGASITIGNFLLPKLASQFQKIYPDMKMRVTISNGENLQNALIDNKLDIALIEGGTGEPELYAEPLDKDKLVLIVPPEHPLLLQEKNELKELLPLLLREKGSIGRTFLDNFFALRGILLDPVWESTSTQALINAVSYGIGISILPEQLVYQSVLSGDVCTQEIVDADFTRQHYLVWHKNKYLTDTMKHFIALCKG